MKIPGTNRIEESSQTDAPNDYHSASFHLLLSNNPLLNKSGQIYQLILYSQEHISNTLKFFYKLLEAFSMWLIAHKNWILCDYIIRNEKPKYSNCYVG